MVSLLVTIVLIVILCAVAVCVLAQLAPGHPGIIDSAIWVFCVVAVLLILLSAFGLLDLQVPKLR